MPANPRPSADPVQLFAKGDATDAERWLADHTGTAWVAELPGGWVAVASVAVDGMLIGTSLTADEALLSLADLTSEAYRFDGDALHTVREGAVHRLPDDLQQPPWLTADPRPVRGLVAIRGARTDELAILATANGVAASAVLRDGWTLVPHEGAIVLCQLFPTDGSAPSVGLVSVGDELQLALAAGGELVAAWEWGVTGTLLGADRLPPGDLGRLVLDTLKPTAPPASLLLGSGFPVASTVALEDALRLSGTAAEVAPRLVSALGLPDAARAHLLGERSLEDEPDSLKVEPAASAQALVATLMGGGALTRSPARRVFAGIAGAVLLTVLVAVVIFVGVLMLDGS